MAVYYHLDTCEHLFYNTPIHVPSRKEGVAMYVTSTAFLKDDLANVLSGIARACPPDQVLCARHTNSALYLEGFYDALDAVATALGVHVEGLPRKEKPQGRSWR